MKSLQHKEQSDLPDLNEVKLRILGGDPKAFFQNTTVGSCNVGSKSPLPYPVPEEFQKGVPREMSKVPAGNDEALFEDQNRNRVKSPDPASVAVKGAGGVGAFNFRPKMMATTTPSSNVSNNGFMPNGTIGGDGEHGCSKSSRNDSASSGNQVEINVDMALPQSVEENEAAQKDDPLVGVNTNMGSCNDSNEIICKGEKTKDSSGRHSGTYNSLEEEGASNSGHHQHYEMEHYQQMREERGNPPSSPKFLPSSEKDLEILKNVRKVYVQLTDDNTPCHYKVSDESQECLFETALGDTNGSIWSRYFKQQQKVILVHDRNQRGVLKLEFGRSRTISCCQTLRFAAMTASFKLKPEEPLCIIFKDKECCVSCCCCPEATYETVPQLDSIYPFSVFTKGRWKNRAELMVKHNDGTILGFIDKEQNLYSLTMGENLKPAMKACLIGFLIAMDVMDRQDAGKLSCYLRPTTILLIILLLMLCISIGGYLIHHFSSMFLSVKDDNVHCGAFDEAAGSRRHVPHVNNDRTVNTVLTSGGGGRGEGEVPQSSLSSSLSSIFNSSLSSAFNEGSWNSSAAGGGNNNSTTNSWQL